jgi:hypothetical protein
MPMTKSYVVRCSADGWMVQREGKKSPESMHKEEGRSRPKGSFAREAGRRHAQDQGSKRQDPGKAKLRRLDRAHDRAARQRDRPDEPANLPNRGFAGFFVSEPRERGAKKIADLVVCQNSADRNPKRNRPFVPPAVCHRSVELSRLPTRVIG